MDEAITITHFAAPGVAGSELAQMLKSAIADFRVGNHSAKFRVVAAKNQFEFMQACLGDDVVVFDGSVEDSIGVNYAAATAQPMVMDHVLVASRTCLPINFFGLREGSTPDTVYDDGAPRQSLTNKYLVEWVLRQLQDLHGRLPRPSEERTRVVTFEQLSDLKDQISLVSESISRRSLREENEKRRLKTRVFISYLSKYSKRHGSACQLGGKSVEDLVAYIESQRSGMLDRVKYLPPGALSSEFMTEQRRWMIVSQIERHIRNAEEFWVFETPDYYRSWWTRAELATLAYVKCDLNEKCPKVFLCQVDSNGGFRHCEADSTVIHRMTSKEHCEMARFFSNANPGTVGYEGVENMRMLKNLPRLLQWGVFKAQKNMMKSLLPRDSELSGVNEEITFDRFIESINSHVYEEQFWEDYIVACPRCAREVEFSSQFDFESFLFSKDEGHHRVSRAELKEILETRKWECHCGGVLEVQQEEKDRFIWWPVRMGRTTGPNGVFVERIPVYSCVIPNSFR